MRLNSHPRIADIAGKPLDPVEDPLPRKITVGLIAFFFVAVLSVAAATAYGPQTEDRAPIETSQLDTRSDPTEAVLLDDVPVAPLIVGTGAVLLVLTIVAFRREWV